MEILSKKRKLEMVTTSMPEGVDFGFSTHRRSHLKSETFSTLVRILSLCVNESQPSTALPIISDAPNPGTLSEELEKVTQHETQIEKLSTENDPITTTNVEAIRDEPSLAEDMIVDNVALLDKNCDNLGVSQTLVEVSVQGAEEIKIIQQSFSFENLEATKPTEEMEINEHLNGEILEAIIPTEEMGINEYPIGEIMEESEQVEDTRLKKVMEELANEIQQKETDLKKPANIETAREIEDGEIPDDSWDTELSFDMFLEDAALINEMKLGEDPIPEEHTKQSEFDDVCREQKRADEMHSASKSYLVDTVEQRMSEGEFKKAGQLSQAYVDDFLLEPRSNKKEGDQTRGGFNFPLTNPGSLRSPVKISEKNLTDNQGTMPTETDNEVREKRKRGPRSKESKANKKKKERIKRAAKQRQQGVKRLRIEPISKPKVVKYCEFYLNGRCQKGDACTFSHDLTPLTKSQPCKFLALQSCLKGDNCPFDHQLSKYPCNNYMSKGYCNRGDTCLFSHKIQPAESPSPSDTSQPDPKSQPLPPSGITNMRKPQNSKNTSFQTPNHISKETTVRTPTSVRTKVQSHPEQNVSGRFKTPAKPPAQPPKGIKLISFGKSSLDESSKRQQDDLPYNKENGVDERFKPPAQPPKGITLLLFGKSSLDESSNRQQVDLPYSKDNGVETNHQKDQNASEKLLWNFPATPLPISQSSNPLQDWQSKNTANSIQKRLMSTLSFAAKHESETMMARSKRTPSLIPAEANKTATNIVEAVNSPKSATESIKTPRNDSSSGSVSIPEGWEKASPILLEYLFGIGGDN